MSELQHTIRVQVGDDKKEIFASFGLVTELAQLVGSLENVPLLDLEPTLAMKVLETCLVPRDERGRRKVEEFVPPEISVESAEKILTFAGEHCMDFFIKALERIGERMKKQSERVKRAGLSLSTTGTSPGETASA